MLQSAIYADLHAQDFGFSSLHRLQRLPRHVAGKISFDRLVAFARGLLSGNDLNQLNAHLRRDIGFEG